jgi:hypothetical protein
MAQTEKEEYCRLAKHKSFRQQNMHGARVGFPGVAIVALLVIGLAADSPGTPVHPGQPPPLDRSACATSYAHGPDSVDWLLSCSAHKDACSTQPLELCASVGDGNCCELVTDGSVARRNDNYNDADDDANNNKHADDRAPRPAAPSAVPDVVLVVYDSDEVLETSVARNFGAYGRTVHISRPFLGFGSKWVALKELLKTGELHRDDVLVVSDGRDVLPNTFSKAYFEGHMRNLSSAPGFKVVFSAEQSCCVNALGTNATRFFNTDGSRADRSCSSSSRTCLTKDYAHNIQPWIARSKARGPKGHDSPFLNAGISVGTAASFLSLIEATNMSGDEDDQAVLTSLWLASPSVSSVQIELDYNGILAKSSDCTAPSCPAIRHFQPHFLLLWGIFRSQVCSSTQIS